MKNSVTFHKAYLGLFLFAISCGFNSVYAEEEKSESLLQRIVDSYINSSKTDQTLKHLLDAKMYLSSAEHDLLVSQNKQSASRDIENALSYLNEAQQVAQADIKTQIKQLIQGLTGLKKKTLEETLVGQDNQADESLKIAQTKLLEAKNSPNVSLPTKKRIDIINEQIQQLRNQIEHTNLREDYEAAMNRLNRIIQHL